MSMAPLYPLVSEYGYCVSKEQLQQTLAESTITYSLDMGRMTVHYGDRFDLPIVVVEQHDQQADELSVVWHDVMTTGRLRSWPDFLSDCIRGRQRVAGHQLVPCCRRKDGRMFRPAYALNEIYEFIRRVLDDEPGAGKVPLKPGVVILDTTLGWKANKFDRHGAPVSTTP